MPGRDGALFGVRKVESAGDADAEDGDIVGDPPRKCAGLGCWIRWRRNWQRPLSRVLGGDMAHGCQNCEFDGEEDTCPNIISGF